MPDRMFVGKLKFKISKQWIVSLLILIIFALSILAFTSPVSEGMGQAESMAASEPTGQTSESTETAVTPTPDSEEMPPTPEEIGYTDGIIIWSTILIIILLIGTLRETIRREGR